MLYMIGIITLLFWIPVVGPMAAGVVGGRKAGGAGKALLAAVLPAFLLMLLLAAFAIDTGIPLVGELRTAMGGFYIPGSVGLLFLGAAFGSLLE
jgi:hypothetical protein